VRTEAISGGDLRRVFGEVPVVRVATVRSDGRPHVVPMWFVWREDGVYASIRIPSRTWSNLEVDPRISMVFDVGRTWTELAGAMLEGRADLLPGGHPALRETMSSWHEKYRTLLPGSQFARFADDVLQLGFARLRPERVTRWDHSRR
jgi:nitroimidazol reductase NimA-like FMN-containing flavoprotein (pyridoxamine 5'-phosphate oxidase superfamily)